MIKIINKIVLKNEEGKILEIPAESFDIEKYINSTILDYKYILEIDGNEMNFPNSMKRTEFLKTINNCLNKKAQKSFNIFDFPIIEVGLMADKISGGFHEGLAIVKKDGKYGFINKDGVEVIPCEYDYACNFSEGLARVRKGEKYGFINKAGVEVIPFEYDKACNFSEGLAAVYIDEKLAFIDKKNNIVINCDKDYYDYTEFHEGLAKVNLKKAWLCKGFIDKTGKVVIPFKYDNASDFSEGLAAVNKYKSLKWGYINKDGVEVIPFEYDKASDFSEGLARVRKGEKYGFINKDGEEVIPCIYNSVDDFHEGLARVRKNGKYGFIDKTGVEVIPCVYAGVDNFSEGLAAVKTDEKYGFIDKTGGTVIPFEYDGASSFSEGLARVKKAGKWIFIDKQNQKFNSKVVIKSIEDVFSITNNSKNVQTKKAYALDFQGGRVLFNSNEEKEEFIKLLDKTVNIDPDYNDDNANEYQKKLK